MVAVPAGARLPECARRRTVPAVPSGASSGAPPPPPALLARSPWSSPCCGLGTGSRRGRALLRPPQFRTGDPSSGRPAPRWCTGCPGSGHLPRPGPARRPPFHQAFAACGASCCTPPPATQQRQHGSGGAGAPHCERRHGGMQVWPPTACPCRQCMQANRRGMWHVAGPRRPAGRAPAAASQSPQAAAAAVPPVGRPGGEKRNQCMLPGA